MPKFSTYTLVTLESFLGWKKKFDAEIYEQKRRLKTFTLEEEFFNKLTGKTYFEKVREKSDKVEYEEDINDDDAEELQEDDYESEDDQDEDED